MSLCQIAAFEAARYAHYSATRLCARLGGARAASQSARCLYKFKFNLLLRFVGAASAIDFQGNEKRQWKWQKAKRKEEEEREKSERAREKVDKSWRSPTSGWTGAPLNRLGCGSSTTGLLCQQLVSALFVLWSVLQQQKRDDDDYDGGTRRRRSLTSCPANPKRGSCIAARRNYAAHCAHVYGATLDCPSLSSLSVCVWPIANNSN